MADQLTVRICLHHSDDEPQLTAGLKPGYHRVALHWLLAFFVCLSIRPQSLLSSTESCQQSTSDNAWIIRFCQQQPMLRLVAMQQLASVVNQLSEPSSGILLELEALPSLDVSQPVQLRWYSKGQSVVTHQWQAQNFERRIFTTAPHRDLLASTYVIEVLQQDQRLSVFYLQRQ